MEKILETERLVIRKLSYEDFEKLSEILKDIDVMYAWEHSFTDDEVKEWIDRNISRYVNEGTGYFSLIEKNTGELAGQVGLHYSTVNEKRILELGYIIMKKHWNKGYAFESAKILISFAFDILNEKEVYALIRPENYRSAKLAEKLGFVLVSSYLKYYNGKDMIHNIYVLEKNKNK